MVNLCEGCGFYHPLPSTNNCRFKNDALVRYQRAGNRQDLDWKPFLDFSVLREWNPDVTPDGYDLVTPVNQVCKLTFVVADKHTLKGKVEDVGTHAIMPRHIDMTSLATQSVDMRALQNAMQNIIGTSPVVEVDKFKNWSATQVRNQVLAVWPRTVEEVQRVVLAAKALGLRVRAAGMGHSWSPLFADEGNVVLYTKHLERPDGRPRIELLQDPADSRRRFVVMATSVTTVEFKEFQLSHGVCIPANVIFDQIQMGGVVVPGCHGAGWDTHPVSDYVYKMRIVDSNGQLREYSIEQDEHMMRAVQCNLGLFGIIIDMTFKVDPMKIVETEDVWIKMKDVFQDKRTLCNLLHNNWSVEFFWFPFNSIPASEAVEAFLEKEVDLGEWDPQEDEVWVRLVNRSDRVDEVQSEFKYKVLNLLQWLRIQTLDVVDGFLTRFPHVAPAFIKSQLGFLKSQFKGKIVQQLPHAIHFLTDLEHVPLNQMEWAFSVDPDCTNVLHAIQEVVALVHKEALEGRFPMNLPFEMRFIGDSQAYMATAIGANTNYGGTGNMCYFEVLTVLGTPGWSEFAVKVFNIMSKLRGARPHWSKEWQDLPGIDNFLRKAYAQSLPQFLSALKTSGADPDGLFLNNRLEHIFFPQGHPGTRSRVWRPVIESTHPRQHVKLKQDKQWCQIL